MSSHLAVYNSCCLILSIDTTEWRRRVQDAVRRDLRPVLLRNVQRSSRPQTVTCKYRDASAEDVSGLFRFKAIHVVAVPNVFKDKS